MPNSVFPNYGNNPADAASTIGDKISDTASTLKDKASEFGRKATDVIDDNIVSAANGLDRAAATLHTKAENLPGVDQVSSMAHTAADKLSATATYFREHDVNRFKEDFTTLVKNNPGPSLLIAGVVGFFLGRAFLGRDRD